MKKSTKVILAVSAAMIVLGGALATFSYFIAGGNIGVRWNNRDGMYRPISVNSGRWNERAVHETVEPGAFTSIVVDVGLADVQLIPSDRYYVEYSYLENYRPITAEVQNGVLTVSGGQDLLGSNNRHGVDLNLFGFDWTPRMGGRNEDECYTRIYFPAGTQLEQVSLGCGLGNVTLADLTVRGALEINAALGNVDLENITAPAITLDVSMGEIDCERLTTERFDANCDMGNLNVSGSSLGANAKLTNSMGEIDAEEITAVGLTSKNSMGNTKLRGDISGAVDISCAMGEAEFTTSRAHSEFSFNLSASMGELRVDGVHISGGGYVENNAASSSLKISCGMGGVKADFED